MEIDWIRVYTNRKGTSGAIDESIGGAQKIFADAASVAEVDQLAVGTIGKAANNEAASFTLTYPSTGGAEGSSDYITFTENSNNAAGTGRFSFGSSPTPTPIT